MQVNSRKQGDILICAISGDIDINTSPDIRKEFEKMSKEQAKKIVLNLDKVSYIDSSGLATLVEALKRVREYGGRIKLTNLSGKVKSLFEITRLEKLFDISNTEEDALKTFI